MANESARESDAAANSSSDASPCDGRVSDSADCQTQKTSASCEVEAACSDGEGAMGGCFLSRGPSAVGTPPPDVADLARIEDRMTFAYFEHCKVSRSDNAITIIDETGVIHLPAASVDVLMLGPGTDVTHRAMQAAGDNGMSVVWVGERGVRMYACGRPLTHSSRLLERQAALVSNTRSRLAVARRMYQMRFPGEDTSRLTMQQLRGREGARIRKVYAEQSRKTGVKWDRRTYDSDDFNVGTDVNKALSAAHACLYGITHAVIVALGCSAGLGFVHTGHDKSFVYDIADLYKAELSIPVAFQVASEHPDDIGAETRWRMRDMLYDLSITERMVVDIKALLKGDCSDVDSAEDNGENAADVESLDVSANQLGLWDDKIGKVASGISYVDPTTDCEGS